MAKERIAITGIGLVSALGRGAELTFERLLAGTTGIAELSLFEARGARSRLAAEVKELDVTAIAPRGETGFSRTDALAFVAAEEALGFAADAGAPLGIVLGGTTGGMLETEALIEGSDVSLEHAAARRLLEHPLSATAERLARAFRAASAATLCAACASGALALIQACDWLRQGRVDRVLAGGADGLCRLTFSGFDALGALDPAACRPFDRARRGLTLGEGAALLLLERESSARARGAQIRGFLTGAASGAEAHHITQPEPSGRHAAELMKRALAAAGRAPRDLDYVNAHGTGTLANDAMEAKALRLALGDDAERVLLSSSKAQLGHTLGAAGAIEAAVTVLSLERQSVPPTVGLVEPEDSGLRHVRTAGQRASLGAALSCSFGFGGTGAALLFEPAEAVAPEHVGRRVTVVVSGVASVGLGGVVSGDAWRASTGGAAVHPGPLRFDPQALLDETRTRRHDRVALLGTALVERALVAAGLEARHSGLALGSAFGNVERSLRFLQRIAGGRGRGVSPAEFPHLVASSASGNASIYLGLQGPVLGVSARERSAEVALDVAVALLGAEQSAAMVAGAVEAWDPLVGAILESETPPGVPRSEGGAVLVLEDLESAARRGIRRLVALTGPTAVGSESALETVAGPGEPARSLVVSALARGEVDRLLARSAWSDCPLESVVAASGWHEALSATALAAAAAAVSSGRVEVALALTGSGARLWATRFAEVRRGDESPGAVD